MQNGEMKFAGIGVVAGALGDEPRQAVQRARGAKFGGIQFDVKMGGLDLTELSDSGRREFAKMLRDGGVTLIAVRADAGADGLAPGTDVDRALWRMQKALETAAGLGCATVCLDLGRLPVPSTAAMERPKITAEQAGVILLPEPIRTPAPVATPLPPPDPQFVGQVDEGLRTIGSWADRYGVTVALRSSLSPFSAVRRAVDAAACAWFGLDFDPVDALQDAMDLDAIFSGLGGVVRHVRARDAVRGERGRVQAAAVGKGSVEWLGILSRLEASGYGGWITVDSLELPQRQAGAIDARNYLANLITA